MPLPSKFAQNFPKMRKIFGGSGLLSRPHEMITFGPTPHFMALL